MNKKYDETFGGYYCRLSWTITMLYGLEASAIYGLIYFRSQLEKGYCCESYANMAKLLKISPSTIKRRINTLKKAKLILDIKKSPSLKDGDTRWFIVNPKRLEELENETYDERKKTLEHHKKLMQYKVENLTGDVDGSQRTGYSSDGAMDGSQRTDSKTIEELDKAHNGPESYIDNDLSNKKSNIRGDFLKEKQNPEKFTDIIERTILTEDFWINLENKLIPLEILFIDDTDEDYIAERVADSAYDFMIGYYLNYDEEEGERELVVRYWKNFLKQRMKEGKTKKK